MSKELRGSEKLMAGCSGVSTLSPDELEQVAGGRLASSPLSSYWRVFPHGVPWPDIFNVGELEKIGQGGQHF